MAAPRATRSVAVLLALAAATPAAAKDPAPAQKAAPPPRDVALAAKIGAAVRAAGGPGLWGAVLVARGGEVLYAEGFGFADYEKTPNGVETLFEIASTSKQVTAAAVLRLEQQKRLQTSDGIRRFFPDAPRAVDAVTLDHLLHHTAGLAADLGVPYAWTGSRAAYARQMLAAPLAAEPGKAFAYSNVGYALLAAVVEEVTGKPFEDYVRRELFAPAGLVDTGFIGDPRLIESPRVSQRRAPGGAPDGTAARWSWGWGYRGMGGVVSTASDLLRWDRALRGDKVLGPAARAKAYAPALAGYACGWQVETTPRGTTKVSHSGGVRGYACQYARWLEEDVVVVVLSNGASDVHAVERAAADLLFAPVPIVLDLDVASYELTKFGAFEAREGLALEVGPERGAFVLTLRHRRRAVAVVHGPKGVFAALVGQLQQALGQSQHPRPDEPAGLEGGIYLRQVVASGTSAHVVEGVELAVLPAYHGQGEDGRPIDDPRTVLVVRTSRGWPVMVKLNPMAVRALIAALEKALA